MKLLNCLRCGDILALRVRKPRTCDCGESSGQYIDKIKVEYEGPARVLGINNYDLAAARGGFPGERAPEFRCWVIADHCQPIHRLDRFKSKPSAVWLNDLLEFHSYFQGRQSDEHELARLFPEDFAGDPIADKHHGGLPPFGGDWEGEEP